MAEAVVGAEGRARVEHALVVEDDHVPGRELREHRHARLADELGEAAAGLVEVRQVRWAGGERAVATRLGGEADGVHAVRPAAAVARRVVRARAELRLQLDDRRHVPEGRLAVGAVVLEAHGGVAEGVEEARRLVRDALRDSEAVDKAVAHPALLARRGTVAHALAEHVEELEVRGRVAVGVVGVEAEGLVGVREVVLDGGRGGVRNLGLLRGGCGRLRADVKHRAPLGGAQRAEVRGHLRAHALDDGSSADAQDADGEEAGERLQPPWARAVGLLAGDEHGVRDLRGRREVGVPEEQLRGRGLVHLDEGAGSSRRGVGPGPRLHRVHTREMTKREH
mmetsp:Transcript_19467/g.65322  ORF Transcript_19467/g.65322 Transcript_19467/m.65322 type:complete len:337 (+) Transcript_19467:956-1966(+)